MEQNTQCQLSSNCLVQIAHGGHTYFSYAKKWAFCPLICYAKAYTFFTAMYYKLDFVCPTVNHRRAFRNVSWEFSPMSSFQKLEQESEVEGQQEMGTKEGADKIVDHLRGCMET